MAVIRDRRTGLLIGLALLGLLLTVVYLGWGRHYLARESARYSDAYAEAHRGRVTYEIPEVYELANVAIAITDYGLENRFRVYKGDDYYQRVLDHFLPYRDHPLIDRVEFSDDNLGNYTSFRDNAVAYAFAGEGKLVPVEPYLVAKNVNLFAKERRLLEDFAAASDFRAFYQENVPYYQEQIALYEEMLPAADVWAWMETHFPQRYDSYKIIFSPLIGATHRTATFADNGFSESVMFLSNPGFARAQEPAHPALLLTQIAFTEIAHNYVDGTTAGYLDEIERAMGNLDAWNQQQSYRSREQTFDEYLTWALTRSTCTTITRRRLWRPTGRVWNGRCASGDSAASRPLTRTSWRFIASRWRGNGCGPLPEDNWLDGQQRLRRQ